MQTRGVELRPGASLGRYLVVSRLGAGGMGVVYAGYDPELDRKVALKLLHPGVSQHAEGRTRLLREAQALAKLTHPNVVAIHDTGTVGENVWLAIEFVAGRTFGDWVRDAPRSWREVLAVMTDAGRGLAAAHAAGLVHRDFKPDNVMVGDDGRVRVMDFGLARATGDAKPVAMGVPHHDVPPPKVDASLDDTQAPAVDPSLDDTRPPAVDPSLDDTQAPAVDPSLDDTRPPSQESRASRSALHVVLTRAGAIAGTPAYMAPEQFAATTTDGRTDQFSFCATLWEALYGARPFAGSTFTELATNVLEGRPPSVPRRTPVPTWLGKLAQRGLARAPEDRWPSMDVLLGELARGRGRARLRRTVVAIGVGGVALAGVAVARQIDERRRTAACESDGDEIAEVWNDDAKGQLRAGLLATGLPTAEVTAEKVMPWLDAQASAWRDASTQACLDTRVRAMADEDRLVRARWCLDESRLQLAAVVEQLSRADAAAVNGAVTMAASLADISHCRDGDALARMPLPPLEQRADVEALRADLSRTTALESAAKYDDALALGSDALAHAETLGWPALVADARQRLASVLARKGRFAEAEAALEEAFFTAAGAGSNDAAAALADSLVTIVGQKLARHADGVRWSRMSELLQPNAQGLRLSRHLQHLASVRQSQGAYDEAIALYERVLAIDEELLDRDHPMIALTLSNIAVARQRTGDYARARADLERALAIREEALGRDHPDVASTLSNLASVHRDLGGLDRAEALHRRALAIRERVSGADSLDVAESLNNLANVLTDSGAREEAGTMLQRALAITEARRGPDHPHVGLMAMNLAWLRLDAGEQTQAHDLFARSVAIFERTLGPDHPDIGAALLGLVEVEMQQRRFDEAVVHAERALRLTEAAKTKPIQLADAQFGTARALAGVGKAPPRAVELAQSALATYVAAGESAARYRLEVEAFLRDHAD